MSERDLLSSIVCLTAVRKWALCWMIHLISTQMTQMWQSVAWGLLHDLNVQWEMRDCCLCLVPSLQTNVPIQRLIMNTLGSHWTKIGWQVTQTGLDKENVYNAHPIAGLYASFLKGQGHRGIFFLVKGTLWWNCKIVLEHFKGIKAMTRGHGGNRLCCLREVSGLPIGWISVCIFNTEQPNQCVLFALLSLLFSLSLQCDQAFRLIL